MYKLTIIDNCNYFKFRDILIIAISIENVLNAIHHFRKETLCERIKIENHNYIKFEFGVEVCKSF